ncbi:MAG TPA: hypothetical protein VMV69_18960 [Pirellulales bacterium]|nr:hypothetical protein [Pirellulales bacterium]
MFDHSRPSWLALALCALACAGCGGRAIGPVLLVNDALVKELRDTTGSKGTEPEEAEPTAPAVEPTEWGDLSGQFLYEGAAPAAKPISVTKDEQVCGKHNLVDESLLVGSGNGLKNVVVFVVTSKKQKLFVNPDYEASANDVVRFDNKNCRFEPHILPVRVSQTLELHNSDAVSHNSAIERENPLLSKGATFDYHFDKSKNEPVTVTCSIHTWMKGYVVVRDNPYMAVSDDEGRFKIEKLPPGAHEFVVWHEAGKGKLSAKTESVDLKRGKFKWEVKPGANELGTISLGAGAFQVK